MSAAFARLPLKPGDRLKQFELQTMLGKGGMGEVWRAKDLNVQDAERIVALKVIKQEFEEQSPLAHRRFRAEIAAIANLSHTNVIPMFGVDEAEGRVFYTMEYVESSLANRIRQHQTTDVPRDTSVETPERPESTDVAAGDQRLLSDDAIARLMLQAARGVHYAHTHAVIHRDLKPDNLLLRSHANGDKQNEEVLLVADFGLAKVLADVDARADGQDLRRSYVGTPHFAAPEQRAGTASVQSDIYSLGATMVAMLTGQPPRQPAESHLTDLGQLLGNPAIKVHPDLAAICLKCLRREPSQRFSSAHELALALERFLQRKQRFWQRVLLRAVAALALILLVISAAAAVRFKLDADTIADANNDLVQANSRSEARRLASEERRKLIQIHLYDAELTNFNKAREAGRFDQVYEILNATSPARTSDDLRGWEWFHLYDLAHSEHLRFDRHPAAVTAAALSPDNETAASGDEAGNVLIWSVKSGAIRHELPLFSGAVLTLAFSQSGSRLAAGSEDTTAVIVDAATGETLHTLDEHVLGVRALAFGPADELLVTGGEDGVIKVTKFDAGDFNTTTLTGHSSGVRTVWVDATGNRVASSADDQTLRFWDLQDGQWRAGRIIDGVPSVTALSPDFQRFALWLEADASVAVVDAETKATLWRCRALNCRSAIWRSAPAAYGSPRPTRRATWTSASCLRRLWNWLQTASRGGRGSLPCIKEPRPTSRRRAPISTSPRSAATARSRSGRRSRRRSIIFAATWAIPQPWPFHPTANGWPRATCSADCMSGIAKLARRSPRWASASGSTVPAARPTMPQSSQESISSTGSI